LMMIRYWKKLKIEYLNDNLKTCRRELSTGARYHKRYKVQGTRYKVQGTRYKVQVARYKLQVTSCKSVRLIFYKCSEVKYLSHTSKNY
jgi:intein-encoded DNA endonuclease-like protein